MKLQQLLSYTRRAIDDYHMIRSNDTIAIGISGGKDSLALLYALHALQRFYPIKFNLKAITVDLGLGIQNLNEIQNLCTSMNIEYYVTKTEIGDIIFHNRKESNPCSLCAKMRKGALNETALKINCNKIAYAHHRDDVIETMLLSLIYEGRFHTFSPNTYLDRTGLYVIRPMIYVNECDIIGFQNKYNLPVAKNPCPADGNTKRQYIKNLLAQLNHENPGVKDRMFHAISSGTIESWKLNASQKNNME